MSILKNRNWQLFTLLAALVAMFALTVPTATADDTFDLTVKHQINGKSAGAILFDDPKALPKELPVDVYVDGNLTIPGFEFGQVVETNLPAGDYLIEVTLAGAGDPSSNALMSLQTGNIPAGADVTITAKLVNQTLTLAVKAK